jgi:magnesium chelatase family protein
MRIFAYQPCGFEGALVSVDVEIRSGLPGFDLVGLPGDAVKEARERVRAAIRNSGFQVPADRVLVSLAPAGLPKDGSGYDLPIALAILACSGQIPDDGAPLLALGELTLSGTVRTIPGALPAVAQASLFGIGSALVPYESLREARAVSGVRVSGLSKLEDVVEALSSGSRTEDPPGGEPPLDEDIAEGDFSEVRGRDREKRALAIAAVGEHPLLMVGPPGVGKTMMLRRLSGIMPDLTDSDALQATALHSLAGTLPGGRSLLRRPPFRSPHHSASAEGLLGGGRFVRPGEISLAHRGILFLDEAPEFRSDVLQALREPVEDGVVSIARANGTVRLPAECMLALAANPCPCGNSGRRFHPCVCSFQDVQRYWKKIGAALLDRIQIRLAVYRSSGDGATGDSRELRERVAHAVASQRERFPGRKGYRNARIPEGLIYDACRITSSVRAYAAQRCEALGFSSRAFSAILKVARSCADFNQFDDVGKGHIEEAIAYRRCGELEQPWEPQY